MMESTDTMEQGEVIIKQEHTYANKDGVNALDDPLKIMPCYLDKIKTENEDNIENVEIKMEPDDEITTVEHTELLDHGSDLNGISYEDNMDIFENPLTETDMEHSETGFVSKSTFTNLLSKYKVTELMTNLQLIFIIKITSKLLLLPLAAGK